MKYADRMPVEFNIVTVRDAARYQPGITATDHSSIGRQTSEILL